MKTYVINLCTDTKNTDRYDKVAVNKFPMLVRCKDIDKLKEVLGDKKTSDFIKENLKQKHLYETAVFYIREIDGNNINEFCLDVIELNKIEY